ncbi:Spherulin-1A [Porphyridium purpureum]|uniref:Spherulin-1A n=1 Tax=Porphyridium purpureum TaxID=35688 RepID=A0A5J4Z0C0_PORPP|nr:Spherulin-1A [Porphyridium purpureum]|eukprot:POR0472..scf208_2
MTFNLALATVLLVALFGNAVAVHQPGGRSSAPPSGFEGTSGSGGPARSATSPRSGTTPNPDLIPESFEAADFVYDFNTAEVTSTGTGGTIRPATVVQFPVVKNFDLSFSLFTLDPGGVNLPHFHPRASEALFLIRGNIRACFSEENDGRVFCNDMKPGQATIFPMANIHYQQNIGSEEVLFMSILNSNNPGVSTTIPRTLALPLDAIASQFFLPKSDIMDLVGQIKSGPSPQGREPIDAKIEFP